MRNQDIEDFARFLKEFQSESDRGAALVGAALLDQKLAETLRAFLVENRVAKTLVEGANAPLGTLAARLQASFALGLIDEFEFREINRVRKVRNEFAHRAHGTTFSDPKIKGTCGSLESDLPGGAESFSDNPRGMYINSVILMALRLTYRAERVARERRQVTTWPY